MTTSIGQSGLQLSHDGGLTHLEHLLRISNGNSSLPRDAVFVSINLDVSRRERRAVSKDKNHIPRIKEVHIASLDTRLIFPSSSENLNDTNSNQMARAISTHHFSTQPLPGDCEDYCMKDIDEDALDEASLIQGEAIPTIILQHLQIEDEGLHNPNIFRNIVIVGHSIQQDLEIIKRLGVEIDCAAPVIAIIDTNTMIPHILGHGSPISGSVLTSIKLSPLAILAAFECPQNSYESLNTTNDATYILYIMLLLALRWAMPKILTETGLEDVERLRSFVWTEVYETPLPWTSAQGGLGTSNLDYDSMELCDVDEEMTYDIHVDGTPKFWEESNVALQNAGLLY